MKRRWTHWTITHWVEWLCNRREEYWASVRSFSGAHGKAINVYKLNVSIHTVSTHCALVVLHRINMHGTQLFVYHLHTIRFLAHNSFEKPICSAHAAIRTSCSDAPPFFPPIRNRFGRALPEALFLCTSQRTLGAVMTSMKSLECLILIHTRASPLWDRTAWLWDIKITLSHELGSEWVSERANEWAVWANERTDMRVAQYLRPDSWLF